MSELSVEIDKAVATLTRHRSLAMASFLSAVSNALVNGISGDEKAQLVAEAQRVRDKLATQNSPYFVALLDKSLAVWDAE